MNWTVGDNCAGLRLDKYLAAPDRLRSRARASAALERGKVFLNGAESGLAAGSTRLKAGDVVRVWMDRPGSANRRVVLGKARDLRIVYEDGAIVVLNKAPGLLSVPLERKSEARSVYDELARYLQTRGRRRPFVVHRIDRDTSGLVVFATDAETQRRLADQFKRHEPERVYQAVVHGHPRPAAGTWRDDLVWDQKSLIQREAHPRDPRGKEATSEYRVIEEFSDAALIEVRLVTGKRNQIRLQASLHGHVLVGERRYVGPGGLDPIAFPRQALHAHRLSFRHPVSGETMQFEAPLPEDLLQLIRRLRRAR
jgi:23S rRNA pseudouridine1911/1915/1917 synthase